MESDDDEKGRADVVRRIKRNSGFAYLVFAVFSFVSGGFRSFLGLTCTSAVTIISFLWLEEVLGALLQPSPQLRAGWLTFRAVARLALLGVALLVSIFVARFDASSVLMGFSVVVVGIMAEAVYAAYRSLAG